MFAKIATGEIGDEVTSDGKNKAAQELGRMGGKVLAEKTDGGAEIRDSQKGSDKEVGYQK